MNRKQPPQSAHTQRPNRKERQQSPLAACTRQSPQRACPRDISAKFIAASNLTRDDKAMQKERIPYVIYMELRADLDFTRAQLVDAHQKIDLLNQEVLLLTRNNMELQLNEKDLQALITADQIQKQIFQERDDAQLQLEAAQEELTNKEKEL